MDREACPFVHIWTKSEFVYKTIKYTNEKHKLIKHAVIIACETVEQCVLSILLSLIFNTILATIILFSDGRELYNMQVVSIFMFMSFHGLLSYLLTMKWIKSLW